MDNLREILLSLICVGDVFYNEFSYRVAKIDNNFIYFTLSFMDFSYSYLRKVNKKDFYLNKNSELKFNYKDVHL